MLCRYGLIASVLLFTAATSLAQDSSALLNQALDQPVKLDLDTSIPEAMTAIAKQTGGVRLEADPAVYDLLPWGQQTNIKAKIENLTLRQALEAITRKLGLTFVLKDEAIELQPMPALRRLGRRSTEEELAALDKLSSTPMGLQTDHPGLKQLVDAVDQKLVDLKLPFAVEYRPGAGVRSDQSVSVPRNATMADALESLAKDTNLTWYPWGKSIVIVPKEDQIRNQLAKTITIRYNGVDITQVLTELSQRAGVRFEMEPGAIRAIPQEFRNIRLQLDNATILQALDSIAGFTGLGYVINAKGVYIWNQSNAPAAAAARDPVVGIITVPDLGMQVMIHQSEVSPDLREYLRHKAQKELDKIRQMMKEEGFKPATRPTSGPASEDL